MPQLRTLDLFSGVGGMTRALHGLATPVAYCDVWDRARRVMTDNIRRGLLPRAPICDDVQQLDATWLRDHGIGRVDMIVGGFPCVGFSVIGKRKGFKDTHSKLFDEIVRLADLTQSPLLFLENVPGVLRMGMNDVARELGSKRGYELRWCICPAHLVGAPHERSRWFCLAVKTGFEWVWEKGAPYQAHPWTVRNMPPRAIMPASSEMHARLSLMGNSVVPDAVRYAFVHMVARCRMLDDRARATQMALPPGATLEPAIPPKIPTKEMRDRAKKRGLAPTVIGILGRVKWPDCGVLTAGAGEMQPCRCPPKQRDSPEMNLIIDPAAFKTDKAPSPLLSADPLTHAVRRRYWATPRHGCTSAANYITVRTVRDLPTQVRFERKTPDSTRGGGVHPVFAEWLMGYPANWTRAAVDAERPTGST